MNLKSILKMRATLAILAVVLIAAAVAGYLGDYFHGNGTWAVMDENHITLIDVEGKHSSVYGDSSLTAQDRQRVEAWLVSQGFSKSEDADADVYQGMYKDSCPIRVAIESDESGRPVKIQLSYKGSGFKRLLDEKIRNVQIFSNELAKQCSDKIR
ncbi:MAG: hypothetical protein JW959_10930 [Pirellulales bacterium]|nr:hypothetical protein [Pirellulales bacterium]